jgi:BCCT, betaine/carnitine/choline family transporter
MVFCFLGGFLTARQEIKSPAFKAQWFGSSLLYPWPLWYLAYMEVSSTWLFAGLAINFFLLVLAGAMDDTKYVLNLQVQEMGYFLQHTLFQLTFWTDAFGQLREGSGRAVDGHAAAQWWQDTWMVFYQCFVVTWAAILGTFMALISRGRKLWEVVLFCFAAPIGYSLVWFCTWGGIGLRQARQGQELEGLGKLYFNSSRYFLADGSSYCYDVPQQDVLIDDKVVFTNYLLGVTPVCQLDPEHSSMASFNVMNSLGDGLLTSKVALTIKTLGVEFQFWNLAK